MLNRRQMLLMSALPLMMTPAARALATETLTFNELYLKGTDLSDKAKAMDGKPIEMIGYMAPPLKARANFFVLTKMPLAVCPFCDSEVDWPTDIVFVRSPVAVDAYSFNLPIRVTGKFATGFEKDAETGFVSFIRIVDAQYEPM